MSRGPGRIQRAVLAHLQSEPYGRSALDGTPLFASVTELARTVYAVDEPDEPSDAQRSAIRRALRRLEDHHQVEVRRLGVGRTYTQRRAHPRHLYPRYEYQLAPCPGPEQDCPGCAAGDIARFEFDSEAVELFLYHFGNLPEATRQLWRATAHGWHWYPVQQPRPDTDYRAYPVEITELCARRALTPAEHTHAEEQLSAFIAPYVDAAHTPRNA
ncbi:hypothetical protein ACIBCO_40975 [Streptomyces violascens]|uniref:hypothetical protein n=1 Tax=Streptomyces violascens TaxID=67381 RepID=UPI0037ACB22A